LLAGDIITSAKLSHDYISNIDLLTTKQRTVHPAGEGSAHSLFSMKKDSCFIGSLFLRMAFHKLSRIV
jgi:hypothetical protein